MVAISSIAKSNGDGNIQNHPHVLPTWGYFCSSACGVSTPSRCALLAQEAFPWPRLWVLAHPAWFSLDQSRVVSVTEVNGLPLVRLYGIVFTSEEEARQCASFLKVSGGLFFDEYD